MADFVFIFLIFSETFLTIYLARKLVKLEKQVLEFDKKLQNYRKPLIELIKHTRNELKKVNKVLSFVTNKKFRLIKQILIITFKTAQIVILLKSFNFKRGIKFNPVALKKLLYTQAVKKIIEKFIFILKSCTV